MKTSRNGEEETVPRRTTLPIGIQDFAKLVQKNCIYVDKTQYVHNLLQGGGIYFLSRPRRFGKSLLISILKEIFSGNKELFKGCWIYDHMERWGKYPVIHLDFLGVDFKSFGLEKALMKKLDSIAKQHGVEAEGESCKEKFGNLIQNLSAKEDKRVVVLIDEYDKPIIDYFETENMKIAEENRKKLKNFYAELKSRDENIEFLFITGVSRFTKVSIFSDLNNLDDITLDPNYAMMFGYTRRELEDYFAFHIDKWIQEKNITKSELMERFKEEYDGYSWDGKNFVYNPDSMHKSFKEQSFANHWFSTGTPTFLVKALLDKGIDIADFENLRVKKEFFNEYDINDINLLLFQTGYLTVKESDETGYRLYYPNKEVQSSLLHLLLKKYSRKNQLRVEEITPKIKTALSGGNIDSFVEIVRTLLADIPYNLSLSKYEAFYHSIIFIAVKLSGLDVAVERETNRGRIDMLVRTERYIYIIEFKMGSADEALAQIQEKKYYEPFLSEGKEILMVGIGFNREDRNIVQFKCVKFE
ncbi:MAG: ATP-binding protein [Candidatus Aminicenantes bacterium]|nr:ATP-binding protein [Candidatus Aminicenantes bacterium]